MVITDFNKMSLEDLEVIHEHLGVHYVINDGRISGTENIPATDAETVQG